MDLSIVTTLYESEAYLEEFYRRISAAAGALTSDYEIVIVNDGSPDGALDVALKLVERDARVRVVDLSRNFGHHRAIMTGLAHARGDRVFLIDCDLEEQPELLSQFYERLSTTGADVVYGAQTRRRGGFWERISGAVFYRLFASLTEAPVPNNLVTIRLMTRRYVQALILHRDREIFLAGLWQITGFQQEALPIVKLWKGSSSYDWARKISILVNAVTSFSTAPLVFIFYLGLAIFITSTAAALYLIIDRVFFGTFLFGWPSLIVSIWMLGGLTIFSIGVIGIYLAKVFTETKDRPYTIVREIYQRENANEGASGGGEFRRARGTVL